MLKTIPLLVPDMPTADDILPYLRRIDQALWYTNFGPLASEFEQSLAACTPSGVRLRVAAVSNCTVGLELALAAAGLPAGARVLLPALTFVATAMAICRAGCQPVLADVNPESWMLTPEIARKALSGTRIDAVMPVSAFGCAVDTGGWEVFAGDTGLPVIIDAAGAFGNQSVGGRAAAVFSLHATKSLGIGEGGFVVAADEAFVARVRQSSNFGIDVTTGNARIMGTNAKLSEYHAAVGLAALARWRANRQNRIELAEHYGRELRDVCPGVTLQRRSREGIYTIQAVRLPGRNADSVRDRLRAAGIETRRWYAPLVHQHVALSSIVHAGPLPVSEALSAQLLGLPFHLALTPDDCRRVCRELAAALAV